MVLRALISLTFCTVLCATSVPAQAVEQAQPQTTPNSPSTAPSTQAPPAPAAKASDKPQVRYNYLNVCTPTADEQKEIKNVLGRIPSAPRYNPDFEISRGRTSLESAEPARYLRLRRELSNSPEFDNVQYSLSTDGNDTHETLVLKYKDPKDVMTVALEDTVSAKATSPASLLDADTPVAHIKLERFGKPSLVLARCEGADQSAYEPVFQQASSVLAAYRKSLGLRNIFRNDVAWLVTSGAEPAAVAKRANAKSSKSAETKKTQRGSPSSQTPPK
jgi:hypothetical protein